MTKSSLLLTSCRIPKMVDISIHSVERLEQFTATNTPKAVKNFSEFGDLTSCIDVLEAFVVLDILEKHRKQTYLAPFLSCWLCAFVLPMKNLGCIRQSVFKPTSLLANEQRVSLAIPILASIYTAQYFHSHRMTIYNFAGATMELNWVANSMNGTNDIKAIDEGFVRLGTKSSFLITSHGMNIHSLVIPTFASWKADNITREETSKAPATSSDKDIFSDTTSDDEANFDIVTELKACNNTFGAIVKDLLAAKKLKLLEKKESVLSSTSATSEDSLAKYDETMKDLTISHTSLEKEIVAATVSATKRKEAEENFQNVRALLESLQ
ncbi:Cell division protein FtsA [Bienertia sinuspersici]